MRGAAGRGWGYDERQTLTFESGSGNNWARGYHTYGPQVREGACELLRREARHAAALLRRVLFSRSLLAR